MYFYAPYLLVYKQLLPNNETCLNVVGIQLKRPRQGEKADKSILVYDPVNTPPNLWSLVKMFVSSADNQVHEFKYHLGMSHLVQEGFCVATHNQLPKTHALRTLLQPHLDETIGINVLARQTLIASIGAFTEKTFVIGTVNGARLVSGLWKNYDFYATSFPNQLKERGFDRQKTDGLEGYYYREDGFKLWDCIGNYTKNVVNTYYKTDKAVENDKCIQSWAEELNDPARANIKGFPSKITEKKELALVLQIIIWNGSALHSVINYSQWPYIGFIKNRPNGLYRPIPDTHDEITQEYIDDALLPTLPALFQILFPWLLSAQATDTTLEKLRVMGHDINEALHRDLNEMADNIRARNKRLQEKGKMPYVFCLPENVACSVNI